MNSATRMDQAHFDRPRTSSVLARSRYLLALLLLLSGIVQAQLTLTVNSTGDASDATPGDSACSTGATVPGGAPECTLRAAIEEANASSGTDTVEFDIPGTGLQSIALGSDLPAISDPLSIDGSTQSGFNFAPVVEIRPSVPGQGNYGLLITAGQSTIRALAVHSFGGNGIEIEGPGSNSIVGNRIGTNAAGDLAQGNLLSGVSITDSPDNVIGGSTQADRNVISGNGEMGVAIVNPSSIGNRVIGNHIGTDAQGQFAIANGFDGVFLTSLSGETAYPSENFIGGESAGEGNLISGNPRAGVDLFRSDRNQVLGNFIGINVAGDAAIPNGDGIQVDGAADNQIGSETGGNVISGNARHGVLVSGDTAIGNRIQGNTIGTNPAGTAPLANGGSGVLLGTLDGGLPSSGSVVGGISAGLGNLISGNAEDGVRVDAQSSGNAIRGNRIGTTSDGLASLENGLRGVAVFDAVDTLIGGTGADGRNIISGNLAEGILVARGALNLESPGTVIVNNFIGLGADGDTAVPNGAAGIRLQDTGNAQIGVDAVLPGNVVSANQGHGIHVSGAAADSNTLIGNFIGVDTAATLPRPNQGHGMFIDDSPNNAIGSNLAGLGNVVSGNQRSGIVVQGASATGNRIVGNFIGTSGNQVELGNRRYGILIKDADDNEIGGTADGDGNEIRFNGVSLAQRGHGVVVDGGVRNAIRGNAIAENAGRGIDLVDPAFPRSHPYAFTLPDPLDADVGSNELQNYPLVTSSHYTATEKRVEWTLYGPADATLTVDLFTNEQADPGGFGEAETYLRSVQVTLDENGRGTFQEVFTREIVDGLDIGPLVSATATDADGNTSEISMIDSDGDAIADGFERFGIDVDEDGIPDYPVIIGPGAGLSAIDRKNVFVEMDYMNCRPNLPGLPAACFQPSASQLEDVVLTFDAAPATDVGNPDGREGITLHLELDEPIPHHLWRGPLVPGAPNAERGWPFFHRIKGAGGGFPSGGFGSPAERLDRRTLAAKRLIYRYAIVADHFYQTVDGAYKPKGTSGIAEASRGINGLIPNAFVDGGNDFFVTLGLFRTAGGTYAELIGTIMHELGHTLGLMHGGIDHVNTKPNYRSVMNYQWQFPRGRLGNYWDLDYSTMVLPTLDETQLVESDGIGGDPNKLVRIGPPGYLINAEIRPPREVPEGGSVDFDNDGNIAGVVSADISNMGEDLNGDGFVNGNDVRLELLYGHNDWANLRFNFLGTPAFGSGTQSSEINEDELTIEFDQDLRRIGDGPGELNWARNEERLEEGAGTIDLVIRRFNGTEGAVSVDYSTIDGSAVAGSDYVAASGTVFFESGEFRKTVPVEIVEDLDAEDAEYFSVNLTNPTGDATIGLDVTNIVIGRSDTAGELEFLLPFFAIEEDGGSAEIVVVRRGGSSGAVSVDYATADSIAVAPEDYDSVAGTLSFADGETAQSFFVPVVADFLVEGNEGLLLTLSNPTGSAVLGNVDQAVLTIENVPEPAATIEFASPIHEPDEPIGTLEVELIRTDVTDSVVSVDVVVEDGTATSPDDHAAVTLTVDFAAGETLRTFAVPIVDDGDAEGFEDLRLRLANPSVNAVIGTIESTEIRIRDDETFYVTNTRDSGPGSLRQAIEDANANPDASVINFDIPRIGVSTIRPGTFLPFVTQPVVIDGYSQRGSRQNSSVETPDAVLAIEIEGSPDLGGFTDCLVVTGDNVVIRGLVINGCPQAAIAVNASNAFIEGNWLGVEPNGREARANGDGVRLSGTGTLVGGASPEAMNLISGNRRSGITVFGNGNTIRGNRIGADIDGDSLGNGLAEALQSGGVVFVGTEDNIVGGIGTGEANLIAGNSTGVLVLSTVRSTIRGNTIRDNVALDIDLKSNNSLLEVYSVNLNDPGDLDGRANEFQNHPVIHSALPEAGGVRVDGRLESQANSTYDLDFYTAGEPHPKDYGGADRYLGSTQVTTNATGAASFNVLLPEAATTGEWISATATDSQGNTSEFSLAQPVGELLTATLVVNSTEDIDDGACSVSHCTLREALRGANNFPGLNTIEFAMPGTGPHVIRPDTPLPFLTESVVIDGYTQPGAAENTDPLGGNAVLPIRLDGSTLSPFADATVQTPRPALLRVLGNTITVRGIGFQDPGFSPANALQLTGVGHRVEGNSFGLLPDGRTARGIAIELIDDALFPTSGVTIGGPSPASKNLIVGGVSLEGESSQVVGNLMGTDLTGMAPPQPEFGSNPPSTLVTVDGANHVIGGTAAGVGNVIGRGGLEILGQGHIVQGNIIGVAADGTSLLRDDGLPAGFGITVFAAGGNLAGDILIGGTDPAAGNVIGDSGQDGIRIEDTAFGEFVTVQGNFIGTDRSAARGLGNGYNFGHGIAVEDGNVIIGGASPGAGNVIAHNFKSGVCVSQGSTEITGNAVYGNLELGIDLEPASQTRDCLTNTILVTPNDPDDSDTGANGLQNFPVLDSLSHAAGTTTVGGSLNSLPDLAYRVEFFANHSVDPSGHGEGQIPIGTETVTTDSNGDASFVASLNYTLPAGFAVTATATDPDGNTSEFSAPVFETAGIPAADLQLTAALDADPIRLDQEASVTATVENLGPDGTGGVRLNVEAFDMRLQRTVPSVPCASVGFSVSCELPFLASGDETTIQLFFRPLRTGFKDYVLSTTANAADPVSGNEEVDLFGFVDPAASADLAVTLDDAPDPALQGQDILFTAAVQNNGSFEASNVQLEVAFTSAVPIAAVDPAGACSTAPGLVTCPVGALAAGATRSYVITVDAAAEGQGLLALAEASATDPPDPNSANNSAVASNYVLQQCLTEVYGSAYIGADSPSALHRIDPQDGSAQLIGGIGFERVAALAYDPSSDRLLGVGERRDGTDTPVLIAIDPDTGAGTELGTLSVSPISDLALAGEGDRLLAYGTDDTLYEIRLDTSVDSPIGPVVPSTQPGGGLVFSPAGELFHAVGELRILDPATAELLSTSNLSFLPGTFGSERFAAAAFDPSTGLYFGILEEGDPAVPWLGTLDPELAEALFLDPLTAGMQGVSAVCRPDLDLVFEDGFEQP